ncbi:MULTISPECIES: response regulator [unclassified Butyrivibrio]|uniref:response regulator n=1 Tax=unclassified Butyrivibrio TaxID=2639466 RepID=UPI0003B73762|nr:MULTISPECIES: response regulator [unclassified Butyrivibrio]
MADKTILIVDDDDMILMMLEKILSKEFKTITAISGEEAIEEYEQYHPDIVLSDYMMPKMNGFEMMDKMHERFGRNIFAIFMTANEQEETEFEVYKHGALEFIRKPIKSETLLQTIRACMDRLDAMKQNGMQ